LHTRPQPFRTARPDVFQLPQSALARTSSLRFSRVWNRATKRALPRKFRHTIRSSHNRLTARARTVRESTHSSSSITKPAQRVLCRTHSHLVSLTTNTGCPVRPLTCLTACNSLAFPLYRTLSWRAAAERCSVFYVNCSTLRLLSSLGQVNSVREGTGGNGSLDSVFHLPRCVRDWVGIVDSQVN